MVYREQTGHRVGVHSAMSCQKEADIFVKRQKYDIRRGMSPPPATDTIQELQTCVACFRQNSLLTKVNENGPQWTF